MNQRYYALCGMIAPILFIFTTILGGALRPGYSHISDTISELFSPGSPNKLLLDTLHTTFTLLLILFGIGLLRFVQGSGQSTKAGVTGAVLYIGMGLASFTTATIFPQDPWGLPSTFPGQMHMIMSGVVTLLSLFSFLFIGTWVDQAGFFPGFRVYSWITIGAAVLAAGFFAASLDSPIMGLAERTAALIGFQWTFRLGWSLFSWKG